MMWAGWINYTNDHVSNKSDLYKWGPFEYAIIMLKWSEGYVYIGNSLYYLICLVTPFPRGIQVDLEGRGYFPTFMLLMLH